MRQTGRRAGLKLRRGSLAVVLAVSRLALFGLAFFGLALLSAVTLPYTASAQAQVLPRFASLKTDRVVVRQAPASDATVLWTFHRLGWPVEVLRENGPFAEVRDSDGAVGWVSTLHLSGRRTAIVVAAPASASLIVLRADGRETARAAAELEPGLQAVVVGCDGRWCRLMIGEVKGWLEQTRLWGVYAGERIE
jgi:SH3-like domain-containing protein